MHGYFLSNRPHLKKQFFKIYLRTYDKIGIY